MTEREWVDEILAPEIQKAAKAYDEEKERCSEDAVAY